MSAAVVPFSTLEGVPCLGVLAKTVHRVEGPSCARLPGVCGLLEEPEYAASSNPGAHDRLVADTDLAALNKPFTDVLILGLARSLRGPVTWLDTEVRVGPLRKVVRVHGERRIERSRGGRLGFSAAQPFGSMPVSWDRAYGGRDAWAEGRMRPAKSAFARRDDEPAGALTYPRNPAGRGFFLDVEPDRVDGCPAPNLEDPEDPVTPDRLLARGALDWLDRPVAACYGPVDWYVFPRVARWLGVEHAVPARAPFEVRRGLLTAEDLSEGRFGKPPDARAYSCAPHGLTGALLGPGEPVLVRNMHPRAAEWQFRLPVEQPLFLLRPPGCTVQAVPGRLKTVLIEPEEDRVTLTWAGALEVAAPYPEEMCERMEGAVRWEQR